MDNILSHEDNYGINLCKTELCPLFRSMKSNRIESIPFHVNGLNKKLKKRTNYDIFALPLNINGKNMGAIEFFSYAENIVEQNRALSVQNSLFPKELPRGVELFFHPSNLVGGDMVFIKDEWIILFDVSGHGISSALICSGILAILNQIVSPDLKIEDLGDILEEKYSFFNESEIYFTCLAVKRDGNLLNVISFGHPAPLLSKNNDFSFIEMANDFPIGWGLEKHIRLTTEINIGDEDFLIIYTDGFTETKTKSGFIGEKGMLEIFGKTHSLKKAFITSQEMNISLFQEDDITLLKIMPV